MAKYQVWNKANIGGRNGTFDTEHFTLDMAMESAKKLSRGTTTKKKWNSKLNPNAQHSWQSGGYEDVEIPNFYAVIERGDRVSTTRCWGIGGVLHSVMDCKKCNNDGIDVNDYDSPCPSCKGASYRAKI